VADAIILSKYSLIMEESISMPDLSFAYSKLLKVYTFLAYQTFNCIVLLVAVNLMLGSLFFVLDRSRQQHQNVDARVSSYRERFADYKAYAQMSQSEISSFLDE